MKVVVYVTPKKNVLDPQGAAVGHAMASLGRKDARNVRVGKSIEFDIDAEDTPEVRAEIEKLCDGLLCNPVIEDSWFALNPDKTPSKS